MILELVPKDHPLLKAKAEKFDFANPPTDPIQLARNLAETMMANNGIGLAANQVGLPYNVFVMQTNPIVTCFNPKIVDQSTKEIYLEEGCLTYPGLFVKVKRPESIRVRYTLPNGETVTKDYVGMTARIFQHEADHLSGITYIARANRIHLEQARNKFRRNSGKNTLQAEAGLRNPAGAVRWY